MSVKPLLAARGLEDLSVDWGTSSGLEKALEGPGRKGSGEDGSSSVWPPVEERSSLLSLSWELPPITR